MPIHNLYVRVVQAVTGELPRELTIDPNRDDQPSDKPRSPSREPKKTEP